MSEDHLMYGARLDAVRLQATLAHLLDRPTPGPWRHPTPVCIWGLHGIGKTAIVEAFARARGWAFAYAAPAQFEEMGDLHGLPVHQEGTTSFAPPDWVPTEPGPGILLLDDLNRADDRILRGFMQLLQRGELVSWRLPEQWRIVCTANPEGGDYSVTPMDEAMVTRLLHLTLTFDIKAWARWATDAGVDGRGISFVLSYPEAVTGHRTTPRSLTQFFEQIAGLDDLQAHQELVYALAMSTLDEPTAASFMGFVADGLARLPEPLELLDAPTWAPMGERIASLATDGEGARLDRLAAVCTRVYLTVTAADYTPGPRHRDNLVALLTHPSLPNDLRAMLHRDLLAEGSAEVVEMVRDPRLAELVLSVL